MRPQARPMLCRVLPTVRRTGRRGDKLEMTGTTFRIVGATEEMRWGHGGVK